MEVIYRFMSLEAFLEVVLSKSLTFVHPSLWEDPYEKGIFDLIDKSTESPGTRITNNINRRNLLAQSWTKLSESDALWRIYSHNKTSIRIGVKIENINKLEDVTMRDVIYTDNLVDTKKEGIELMMQKFARKRIAFEHEKEVRLFKKVKLSVFSQELYNYMSLTLVNKNEAKESTKNFFGNQKIIRATEKISFSHIDCFIDSVMLNPFSPNHVDETIKELCIRNNLKYLGKSKLYEFEK